MPARKSPSCAATCTRTRRQRERLNMLLVALSAVERYMRNVMEGGKIAAAEIERERTLRERMRSAANW